ncbi:hypothetical protein DENIT_12532 [Pseudomonas veronii]|nr:hypothetical protein DENIT_12532 [Pseudomonas veronii]
MYGLILPRMSVTSLGIQGLLRRGSLFSTVSWSNLSSDPPGGFSLTHNSRSATLTPLLCALIC